MHLERLKVSFSWNPGAARAALRHRAKRPRVLPGRIKGASLLMQPMRGTMREHMRKYRNRKNSRALFIVVVCCSTFVCCCLLLFVVVVCCCLLLFVVVCCFCLLLLFQLLFVVLRSFAVVLAVYVLFMFT